MGASGGFLEDGDTALAPGTRLGKYEIIRLLGAGGMGAVYEASHVEIGKHVAVKVLGPSVAAIPGARARFLREAQLTSRVRHPNIVDVTDMGNEAGQTYLVMELLRGEDLSQRLSRGGPLSPRELADFMLPVCAAVSAAHLAGVTHRDLKPQNIFLAQTQSAVHPKVLDFGISKGNDAGTAGTLTGTGAMIGTPFYLAPEQIMDNRSAGPASDQYSLGVILYECLTGSRPFDAENLFVVFQAIVAGTPQRPRERRPDLPADLEAVVMRAMNLNPMARFDSVEALGRALIPFASERARLIWEEAFRDSDGGRIETKPFPSMTDGTPPPRVAMTTPLPPQLGTTTPIPPRLGTMTPLPPSSLPGGAGGPWSPAGRPKGPSKPSSVSGTQVMSAEQAAPILRQEEPRFQTVETDDFANELRPSATSGRGMLILGVIVAAAAVGGFVFWSNQRTLTDDAKSDDAKKSDSNASTTTPVRKLPAEPESYRISVTTDPDNATVELDGTVVGSGSVERKMLMDHSPHSLRVSADGFEARTVEFTDVPPPKQIVLTRRAVTQLPTTPSTPESSPTTTHATGSTSHRDRDRGRSGSHATSSAGPKTPKGGSPHVPSSGGGDPPPRGLNPNGAPIID